MAPPSASKGRQRLSEQIYQQLLGRIMDGVYKPGDIMAEKTLAGELGVSRTPVHDAIRELINDGFVQQEMNRRPTVRLISADDVYDIFEMLILLEGAAAEKAAPRIDRPSLVLLRDTVEGLLQRETNDAWLADWAEYEDTFHRTITENSGSYRLTQDITRHRLSHQAFNSQGPDANSIRTALKEHKAVLTALDNRDGAKAKQAMQHHIREWQAFFVSKFRSR